ncbi:DUF1206 domain-containing protein [Marinobacter sp.]|uniref:DUF1206 domain-containing protein n=1 Tax=Marinobacter sp. TaxID=50741 RepID=UPI003565D1CF
MENSIQIVARAGYASRGILYLVVGLLALMSAAGMGGGQTTSARGALVEILEQPFGRILLLLMVAGLVGFSLWRAIQGLTDADHHGRDTKALVIRGGHLLSAVTHGFLAYWAVTLMMAAGNGGSGGPLSEIDEGPATLAMVAAGALLAGIGVAHMFKGWTARFERYMTFPANHETWARHLCRFGLVARGLVWCIVGGMLIHSAIRLDSREVQGTGEALDWLAGSPYGQWLLGIVAAGLVAFGIYSCLEARYRHIRS